MTRGTHARRGWRFGLHGLATALALMCGAPPVMAAGLQCGHLGTKASLTREQVDVMQRQLSALGFDPGGNDGLWGPNTRAALHDFCLGAVFARNDDLRVMLRNHDAIHRAFPDWEATFASKDFQQWMVHQTDAAAVNRVRQSGDAAQVIALLRRYGGWLLQPVNKPAKPAEKAPAKRSVEKAAAKPGRGSDDVSYALTKADFKQLKSNAALADAIDKLAGEPYADREGFKAAAGKALKDVPDADTYVEALAAYGQQRVSYILDKSSFDALKVDNVPDYVQQALAGMQGLKYPPGAFVKAMDSALSALSARAMALRPKLVKFAQITPTGARMTKDSLAAMLKAYPGDALVAAVAKALKPRQGEMYKSDKALSWAVNIELMAMVKRIGNAKPEIAAAAVRMPKFVIDKIGVGKVADAVRKDVVPGGELALLGGLQGVDFPEQGLFRQAVVSRISLSDAGNATLKSIDAAIVGLGVSKLDGKLMAAWAKAKIPAPVIDRLRGLQGKGFDSIKSFEAAVKDALRPLADTYGRYVARIVAQARKEHAYRPLPIQWDGAGFSCVSRRLSGDVYGFYPYWMAGKKQSIDFSMQSRIDYFGLRLDDKGNIADRRQWRQGVAAQSFIREAHTYCAKVDMVAYHKDWQGWQQHQSLDKLFFETAADSIARLVAEPMNDALSRSIPYLTLGMGSVPTMGDGVTLYFPGYPDDRASVTQFDTFIDRLVQKLGGHGRRYAVNLMFPSRDLGKGIYGYAHLFSIMKHIEQAGLDARFLILLQDPTSRDKKVVRQHIEDNLKGEQRRQVLRHVAMIVTPGAESTQQLADDVDYAADNFGGIGFWTQPIMPAAKPVMAAIRDHYQIGTVRSLGALSDICTIVCPHRWLFRFAWGFFALVLAAAIPLYMQACKLRVFVDRHFITILACAVSPFVLLSFALLYCDPSLEAIAQGNGLLLLVIAGIIVYAVWRYRKDKRRARLP